MHLRDARFKKSCFNWPWQAPRLKIEKDRKIVIIIINTKDMLIAYSDKTRKLVDSFKKKLDYSFEATTRSKIEHYMDIHVLYDKQKGLLTLHARRWLHPAHGSGFKFRRWRKCTPRFSRIFFENRFTSQAMIDVKLRDKVWQAHSTLIHLVIWARPDLVHSISVLVKYVHDPSEKLWNACSRIAKYLVKTRDFKLAFGTPDIKLMDLELRVYGHSASEWGGSVDDRRRDNVVHWKTNRKIINDLQLTTENLQAPICSLC